MADIQHAAIPDANLHECKGAATASTGQFLRAVGDGTATFQDYSQTTSDFRVLDGLRSESFVNQTLNTQGDELQISYGAAQTSPAGNISIAADGTITFNTSGVYHVVGSASAARSANVSVAELAFGSRYNGTPVGSSDVVLIDGTGDSTTALDGSGFITAQAGDTLTRHMLLVQDPGGNAGIYARAVAEPNWNDGASAHISVTKLGNVEV